VTVQNSDECMSLSTEVVLEVPECIVNCETAFARLEGDVCGGLGKCFISNGFNNWGWTNPIRAEGSYELPLYAGAAHCNPSKGWGHVGTVHIDYNDGNLTVQYLMDASNYSLSEVQVFVGCGEYPLNNGSPTVAPGQYTHTNSSLNKVIDYTVTYTGIEGSVWVIAHAVVCDVAGSNIFDGGNMALDLECEEQPLTPPAAKVSLIQPTCEVSMGTIEVTSPLGSEYSYSIGGAFQNSPVFNDVLPGTYNVTVQNADECMSLATVVVIDEFSVRPAAPTVSLTQPDCIVSTGTIRVTSPLGGYTYSIGGAFQNSPVFNDVLPGTYGVTVQNSDECMSLSTEVVLEVPECIVNCETAFARLEGDEWGACFIGNGFNRWGWTNPITEEGSYELPLYAGAAHCNSSKGWGQIGIVHIDYIGGNMTVRYLMDGEYSLSEVHVYVGYGEYPLNNGNSTVAPGQYTHKNSSLNKVIDYTVTFTNVEGSVWVIAHAVVCDVAGSNIVNGGNMALDLPTGRIIPYPISAYPNPFSGKVVFEFTSVTASRAVLEITDILGSRIATLVDKQVKQGELNRIEYEPGNEKPGTLIYRLMLDDVLHTGKIIYQK
jgi:hypothetical protein